MTELQPIAVIDVKFTIDDAHREIKNRSWDELADTERELLQRVQIGSDGNLSPDQQRQHIWMVFSPRFG